MDKGQDQGGNGKNHENGQHGGTSLALQCKCGAVNSRDTVVRLMNDVPTCWQCWYGKKSAEYRPLPVDTPIAPTDSARDRKLFPDDY